MRLFTTVLAKRNISPVGTKTGLRARELILLLMLVGVGISGHSLAATRLLDRTLVTVNDEVILQSDVDDFISKANTPSFKELYGGIGVDILKDRAKALEFLIEEKIVNQQVKKLDLGVTDQEIDGQIRAILRQNGITQSQLLARLQQLGTTFKDYREGIRRQLERRNLVDREIRPSLEISDEQLRYFFQKQVSGKGDLRFTIAHIFIDQSKKGKTPPKQRAELVWKEVSKHPEKFADYVGQYSDDETTLANGGLLGSFSLSSLSEEFRKVVPKTPVNSVTAPLKTAAGYHIIKVLSKTQGDFSTLTEDQKASLRNQMVSVELERMMSMWLERKKREAHIRRFSNETASRP